jgi:hypothetical protein
MLHFYISLAGEYGVASELLKWNLNATVTFGNAKSADVVAYGSNRKARIIGILWEIVQTGLMYGQKRKSDSVEDRFNISKSSLQQRKTHCDC